jgi:hypothetical protein
MVGKDQFLCKLANMCLEEDNSLSATHLDRKAFIQKELIKFFLKKKVIGIGDLIIIDC